MKSGLFAHTRNPLYVGNFLIVTGGIVTLNLLPYYIIFLPLFYLIYYSITLAEEEYLKGKFGREYEEYLKSVNRYIPGNLSKIGDSFRDLEFTWKRFFKREYSSTVVIFFAILLADIVKFRYRHNLPFDSLPSLMMWGVIALLISGLIIVRILARTGRLEWSEEAPKH
jgi:protein-S-isoprenylcysteine O-methyltransferase Ste14